MRDLVSRAALGTPGRQKVYIVDEVHMLSTPASNALLKTLEEPPSHVVFVLATTDPQKVLPTIRSRTQHFEFRLLGPETLEELLSQVRRDAQLDIPDEAVDLAVRRGRGSARDALSVLDQVAASDWVDDDLPEVDEVVEALAEREVGRALVALAQLTSAGYSPQQLAGDLVDHLRQGFLALVAPDLVSVSESEHAALAGQAERVGLATLVRAMEVLGQAQVTMRDAPDPRVTLEVALVRLAHPEVDATPGALLARIERLESSALTGVPPSASLPPAARTGTGSPSRTTPSPAPEVARPPTPTPGPAEQLAERARSADEPVGRRSCTHRPGTSTGAARGRQAGRGFASRWVGGPVPDPRPVGAGLGRSHHRSPPSQSQGVVPGRSVRRSRGRPGPVRFAQRDPPGPLRGGAGRDRVSSGRALRPAGAPDSDRRYRIRGLARSGFRLLPILRAGQRRYPGHRTRPPAPRPPAPRPPAPRPPPTPPHRLPRRSGEEEVEDLSTFDEAEMGEVADVDNSAETRVLQAFPGAEEVG